VRLDSSRLNSFRLDSSAFFADRELIDALAVHSHSIDCSQDRVLFSQGDSPTGLYILHQGDATLTMRSAQGEVTLCVVCIQTAAGSLLGLPGIVSDEPYSLAAVAHRGAQVSFIAREDFDALIQREPQISLKLLRVLAAEVRSARHALLAA
jgi:CRP-like cAMP-binding protein